MLATLSRRSKNDESGAAAVEFAIVLPILLLLVFGIIEFGLLFNRFISVTHAAREGVRVAALTGDMLAGETAGEQSAPDLVSPIDCTGDNWTVPGEVKMTCSTPYAFALFIITDPITLTSGAKMTSE